MNYCRKREPQKNRFTERQSFSARWVPGTSPGMTICGVVYLRPLRRQSHFLLADIQERFNQRHRLLGA
jgi:hypothetical protein